MATLNFLERFTLMSIFLTAALSVSVNAYADGPSGSGGGDARCEERFKDIRNNLAKWFELGGPERRHLDMSAMPNLTYDLLTEKVSPLFKEGSVIVKCVNPEAKNLSMSEKLLAQKLIFHDSKKICIYETLERKQNEDPAIFQVICDSSQIRPVGPEESVLVGTQFVQVSHEFFGMAGLESPLNPGHLEDSNYPLSSQFRSFTSSVTVERLSIVEKDREVQVFSQIKYYKNGNQCFENMNLKPEQLIKQGKLNYSLDLSGDICSKDPLYNVNLTNCLYYQANKLNKYAGELAQSAGRNPVVQNLKSSVTQRAYYLSNLANAVSTRNSSCDLKSRFDNRTENLVSCVVHAKDEMDLEKCVVQQADVSYL
ncbi:MAG: hypothetical protein ACXVCP_09500 [Bdellovibrio sp.]